jgi:hypothetical protein
MRNSTTFLLAAAIATLALAPPAAAHKLDRKTAKTAALREAEEVARETGAKRAESRQCRRRTKHSWRCVGILHYRSGAAVCKVPITVAYRHKGHEGRALRRERGEVLCY